MKLSNKIMEVLEDHNWTLCTLEEHNGKFYADIENYSPLGEYIMETIIFDGTDQGFICGVKENAASFDTDDYINDAIAVQAMFNNLVDELNKLDI